MWKVGCTSGLPQPILGVSSLDLGRSFITDGLFLRLRPPLLVKRYRRGQAGRGWLSQCNIRLPSGALE